MNKTNQMEVNEMENKGKLTREQMLEYIKKNIPELTDEQIERLYGSIWGMTGKC